MNKKYELTRSRESVGLGGTLRETWEETKIIALAKDDLVPEGAKSVPDDTPVSDWARKGE